MCAVFGDLETMKGLKGVHACCRKHAQSMKGSGLQNPAARLFSQPAGDYGSMVNERVGAGNWDSGQELGDTWASRNAFSYGRCVHPGKLPRPCLPRCSWLSPLPFPLHLMPALRSAAGVTILA